MPERKWPDLPPDSFRYFRISLVVEEVTHIQDTIPRTEAKELKGYRQIISVFDMQPETDNYGHLGRVLKVLKATGEALGDEER